MCDDRNMVGWALPSARLAQDVHPFKRRDQIGRTPDVIQAPAAVAGLPVAGAVAPPGIEFLVGRYMLTHQVGPAATLAHRVEAFGFHRRVADHLEHLLV